MEKKKEEKALPSFKDVPEAQKSLNGVIEFRFGCSSLKSVGRKGKVTLFRRPATWQEGGLVSKSQLPTAYQGQELLKGSFMGL